MGDPHDDARKQQPVSTQQLLPNASVIRRPYTLLPEISEGAHNPFFDEILRISFYTQAPLVLQRLTSAETCKGSQAGENRFEVDRYGPRTDMNRFAQRSGFLLPASANAHFFM